MTDPQEEQQPRRWPGGPGSSDNPGQKPWQPWGEEQDDLPPLHWSRRSWRRRQWMKGRRPLLWPFAILFGGLSLLFLLALASVLIVVFASPESDLRSPAIIILVSCAVPFVFLFLAALMGRWSFRRFILPVSDVMEAADAVARGDLSVRVRENYHGAFGRLAGRFNNMITGLQRAEQQRRNMTADIAHELRNPLHVIQGNLEGMLDGVYEPTPEMLTATLEETHLLTRLVGDLQTLSLAEAGQLPLHPIRFEVSGLLSDVVASFAAQAAGQGIRIEIDLPEPFQPLEMTADPDRLDQVLSNLVSNSLRHTPPGGVVTLSAASIPGSVRLSVSDTGSGIAPEDLPYVFDRFWRADRARTRTAGSGSGLGLAIARQLVQAHGGTIQVESQVGSGTSFKIDIPQS